MADVKVEYDKSDLRTILRSYKGMSDEAQAQGKKLGFELAEVMVDRIRGAASTTQERRIASTGRASRSSKIGEFQFGYNRKDFSGGAYSSKNLKGVRPFGKGILAGIEFGSDNLTQFRSRTSGLNGGNSGYFIYPTLRKNQPYLIDQWEQAFDKILKEAK
jgi:hypothetical protein